MYLGQMVTEHHRRNNYRSRVERRGVNPDLPSLHSKLLEHHVCYSPSFRARLRHPEELWFTGKILGYRERDREKRKFFWEPRLVQQNWAEHCAFSSSLYYVTPKGWRGPELPPLRLFWLWGSSPRKKSMVQEDCCHHHPHMFISYICWAM